MPRQVLMIVFAAIVLLSPLAAMAGDIDALRVEPWYGLIHDRSDPDKLVLSATEACTPVSGANWDIEFNHKPDRSSVRVYAWGGSGGVEPALECQVPDSGTWYVGVIIKDDEDHPDKIILKHQGSSFGMIYSPENTNQFTMYVVEDPIVAGEDDVIRMNLQHVPGTDCHRIRSLVLWREPIERPTLVIRDFSTQTMGDGSTQVSWWSDLEVDSEELEIDLSGPGGTQVYPVMTAGSVHRVIFDDLVHGASYSGSLHDGLTTYKSFSFVAGLQVSPGPSVPRLIPLRVDEPTDLARSAWPVSSGVPFPPGELSSVDHLRLFRDNRQLPLQAEVLSRWPDNSIQWLLISFVADTNTAISARYELEVTSSASPSPPPVPRHPVTASKAPSGVTLENGLMKMVVGGSGGLTDRVWLDLDGDGVFSSDEQVTHGGNHDLVLTDENGAEVHLGVPDEVEIVSAGPVKGEVLLAGWHGSGVEQLMRYRARVRVYADNPIAELSYTLDVNGPDEMNRLQSLALHLRVNNARKGSIGDRLPVALGPQPPGQPAMTVLQDYDFKCLVDGEREGSLDETVREEGFADIFGVAGGIPTRVVAAVEDFWQTYPKGLALVNDGLRIDLMPRLAEQQYVASENPEDPDIEHVHSLFFWCARDVENPEPGGLSWGTDAGHGGQYKLRMGMRVRTTMRLAFLSDQAVSPALSKHLIEPLFAVADPDVYLRSTWFGEVDPAVAGHFTYYESMVARWVRRLRRNQDVDVNVPWSWSSDDVGHYGAFGWANYGDSYYEQRGYNWHNQEYDYPWAMLLQFARTGRTDLLWFAERGARHLATIDMRHHAGADQTWAPANWVGLPWKHSIGHVGEYFPYKFYEDPGQLQQWVDGCQDPFGHVVLDGLFTAGFLTGDRDYLESANRAADKVAELAGEGYDTSPWGFEFTQLRRPGWVISNMSVGYMASNDNFRLNVARMVRDRTLMRQTPYVPSTDSGGSILIPHFGGETGLEIYGTTYGTGVLCESLVRIDRLSPDPRTAGSLRDFARSLIHTNYKPEVWDFWYYRPANAVPIDPLDNVNSGTIVMSALAQGFDAEPVEEMCRVQNVLMYLTSYYSGKWTPFAASFGYAARSLPEALYTIRRWGFTESAQLPGVPPLHGPDAYCQYDPDTIGIGVSPREVCGDGFNNNLDPAGTVDEAGFFAGVSGDPPYDPPVINLTTCSEYYLRCEAGERALCGSDVGTCQSGIMKCQANGSWSDCTPESGLVGPTLEVPDGLDNDCDGFVDEM